MKCPHRPLMSLVGLFLCAAFVGPASVSARERSVLPHAKATTTWDVSFVPGGRMLVSVGKDGVIKLWDLASGKMHAQLFGPTDHQYVSAISPDGRLLATGGNNAESQEEIRIWDLLTERLLYTLDRHKHSVTAIAFSKDGQRFASADFVGQVRVWDLKTRQSVSVFDAQSKTFGVKFSPDGNRLYVGSEDGKLRVWDLQLEKQLTTLQLHRSAIRKLALSPDGKTLATGSLDRTIKLLSLPDLKTKRVMTSKYAVYSVAFSPKGKLLGIGSDKDIQLWDAETGAMRDVLDFSAVLARISGVSFSSDGKTLAAAAHDGTVRLLDIANGKFASTTPVAHSQRARTYTNTTLFPQGNFFLLGDERGRLRIVRGNDLVQKGESDRHSQAIWGIGVSPDEKTLVTGGQDLNIRVTDLTKGQTTEYQGYHKNTVLSVTFSPNKKLVWTGGYDRVIFGWGYAGSKLTTRYCKLTGHRGQVDSLTVSSDGTTLASGDRSGEVRLWDIKTAKQRALRRFNGDKIISLLFSPDGETLWIGTYESHLYAWNIAENQLEKFTRQTGSIMGLGWAVPGKILVLGSYPNLIEVWDVSQRMLVAHAVSKVKQLQRMNCATDGRSSRIYLTGKDGRVELWRLGDLLGSEGLQHAALPMLPASAKQANVVVKAAPPPSPSRTTLSPKVPGTQMTQSKLQALIRERLPADLLRLSNSAANSQCDALIRTALRYENAGEWEQAVKIREQMFWLRSRAKGFADSKTAAELQRLVIPYLRTGQHNKASVAAAWSMKILEATKPKSGSVNAFQLALASSDLASVSLQLGNYTLAEVGFAKSHKILREFMVDFERMRKKDEKRSPFAIGMTQLEALYSMRASGIPVVLPREAADAFIATSAGLALYYQKVGNQIRALEVLQDADNLSSHWIKEKGAEAALLHNELGHLYLGAGNLRQAKDHLSRADRIYSDPDTKDLNAKANHVSVLQNLAVIDIRQGRLKEAKQSLGEAVALAEAEFGPGHLRCAQLRAVMAERDLQAGDLKSAEEQFRQTIAVFQERVSESHPLLCSTRARMARLHVLRGEWEQTGEAYTGALRSLHTYIVAALPGMSDYEQMGFFRSHGVHELNLGLALPDEAYAQEHIRRATATWLINYKGLSDRVFADRVRGSNDEDTELAKLRKELRDVRNALSRFELLDSSKRTDAVRDEVKTLTTKETHLSKRISEAVASTQMHWISIDDVRKTIPPEGALVLYHVHPKSANGTNSEWMLRAWVITAEGKVHTQQMGNIAKIEESIQAVRETMRQAPKKILRGEGTATTQAKKQLADLADLVLTPLMPVLKKHNQWIVCPDDDLWLVPWSALPVGDGETYALENHRIQLVVSARDLLSQSKPENKLSAPLIVADPLFDLPRKAEPKKEEPKAEEAVVGNLSDFLQRSNASKPKKEDRSGFDPLPETRTEAKAAEAFLKKLGLEPSLYLGKEATEDVLHKAGNPSVVVLMTHAFTKPHGKGSMNPYLRCGFALAGANHPDNRALLEKTTPKTDFEKLLGEKKEETPPGEDGVLTGLEILGLRLKGTRLVVLSACNTGLGEVSSGIGVQGLVQAFRYAGAQNVVSSLWSVDDRMTAELMSKFWGHYAQQRDPVEALRLAQKDLIEQRRAKKRSFHPYYWAAFSVSGALGQTPRKAK